MTIFDSLTRYVSLSRNQPASTSDVSIQHGSTTSGSAGGLLGTHSVASSPAPAAPRRLFDSLRTEVRSLLGRVYAQLTSLFGRRSDPGASVGSSQAEPGRLQTGIEDLPLPTEKDGLRSQAESERVQTGIEALQLPTEKDSSPPQAELQRLQTEIVTEPPTEGRLRALMGEAAARLTGTEAEKWTSGHSISEGLREAHAKGVTLDTSQTQWVRNNGFAVFQVFCQALDHGRALQREAREKPSDASALGQRAAALRADGMAIRDAYMKIAGTNDGQPSQDIEDLLKHYDTTSHATNFPIFSADGRQALLLPRASLEWEKPWLVPMVLQPRQALPVDKFQVKGNWEVVLGHHLNLRELLQVAPPFRDRYLSESDAAMQGKE